MATRHPNASARIIRAAVIYGAIWLVLLVLYWGSLATGALGGGGIMGYTILSLYIALPIAGIASAFLIGRVVELRWRRLAAPVAIGALYVVFIASTFGLSTALGLTNIAAADLAAFAYGLAPAAVGLAIGWATARRPVEASKL